MEEQTSPTVQLIIKAPSSKYEDFKISCQLTWTIFELKTAISEEYPSKPNTSDQRLIYSGHLLKDEQYLRDIIELSSDKNDSAAANNTYTFHLVCANRSTTSAKKATTSSTAAAAAATSATSTTPSSTSSTMPPNATASQASAGPSSSASASASSSNSGPTASTSSSTTTTPNNTATNPAFDPWSNLFANTATTSAAENPDLVMNRSFQAYYAMMQQYCQYMNYHYSTTARASGTNPPPAPDYDSYLAFANTYLRNGGTPTLNNGNQVGGGNLVPPFFAAVPNAENAAGVLNPPNNDHNNNNNNVVPGEAAGVVNRNNRNNRPAAPPAAPAAPAPAAAPFAAVAAAAAVAPDDNNRDWMDMMYSFCKAMVILSIMYFYSSIGRLLLLLLIIVFLYLYKTTRLQQNRNNNNNNNVENNNNGVPPPAPPARPEEEAPAEAANNNNNGDNLGQANLAPAAQAQAEAPVASPPEEVVDNAAEAAVVPENSRYSGLRLVWVFVSSLFTSLIPDPVPIN